MRHLKKSLKTVCMGNLLARMGNRSPKPYHRLMAGLAHFELLRRGMVKQYHPVISRPHLSSGRRHPLTIAAALSAVTTVPKPVLRVLPDLSEEAQALIHLENYRRMVAEGPGIH